MARSSRARSSAPDAARPRSTRRRSSSSPRGWRAARRSSPPPMSPGGARRPTGGERLTRSPPEGEHFPMSKLTTCLWFDGVAEEAATFYTSLFPNSRITGKPSHTPGRQPQAGRVMTVQFRTRRRRLRRTQRRADVPVQQGDLPRSPAPTRQRGRPLLGRATGDGGAGNVRVVPRPLRRRVAGDPAPPLRPLGRRAPPSARPPR